MRAQLVNATITFVEQAAALQMGGGLLSAVLASPTFQAIGALVSPILGAVSTLKSSLDLCLCALNYSALIDTLANVVSWPGQLVGSERASPYSYGGVPEITGVEALTGMPTLTQIVMLIREAALRGQMCASSSCHMVLTSLLGVVESYTAPAKCAPTALLPAPHCTPHCTEAVATNSWLLMQATSVVPLAPSIVGTPSSDWPFTDPPFSTVVSAAWFGLCAADAAQSHSCQAGGAASSQASTAAGASGNAGAATGAGVGSGNAGAGGGGAVSTPSLYPPPSPRAAASSTGSQAGVSVSAPSSGEDILLIFFIGSLLICCCVYCCCCRRWTKWDLLEALDEAEVAPPPPDKDLERKVLEDDEPPLKRQSSGLQRGSVVSADV